MIPTIQETANTKNSGEKMTDTDSFQEIDDGYEPLSDDPSISSEAREKSALILFLNILLAILIFLVIRLNH